MTITPSTALHVETPKLADVKSTYPPTPVTAYSQHSATSSRTDLPAPPMPELPLPTKSHANQDITATETPSSTGEHPSPLSPGMSGEDNGARRETVDQGLYERGQDDADQPATGKRGNDGLAPPRISIPGIVCAPPDILPPSPPLTVNDPREDHDHEPQAGSSTLQEPIASSSQSANKTPPPMREEDITNWRASMGKGAEDEKQRELGEDDELGEMNEDYDPYDLGYSPETPIGPSHARASTTPTGTVSLQQTSEHPLRPMPNPPTPPLWETIQPPRSTPGANSVNPRPLTSRPLIPHSAYYFGPPPIDSAYGTDPVGHIGVHHPREILRVERDYESGELAQFATNYPLELEGRITPTQFLDTINTINEHLIAAHSLRHSFIDNALALLTLQLSRFVLHSHYEKEMERLRSDIDDLNVKVYNPVGLNILWPRKMAFMFLEIEYY